MKNLQVNGERLWNTIMETARFGGTDKGGVCRLTLSDVDRQVRDWFVKQCEAAGCTISIDEMGSIFARRPMRPRGTAHIERSRIHHHRASGTDRLDQ